MGSARPSGCGKSEPKITLSTPMRSARARGSSSWNGWTKTLRLKTSIGSSSNSCGYIRYAYAMESSRGATQNAPFSTGATRSPGKRLSIPWPMAEAMLDQAGQRRPQEDAVDALGVHELQPGTGLTEGGQRGDGLAKDLAGRFALGVAPLEVLLLGPGRRHLLEGRVRDVVADAPLH